MTEFRLRRITTHPHVPNAYQVMMRFEDGYDLAIGSIGEQIGAHQRRFWSWGVFVLHPTNGISGEATTREEAMARFRTAWDLVMTPKHIAELRYEAEFTARKYAAWAAGKPCPIR